MVEEKHKYRFRKIIIFSEPKLRCMVWQVWNIYEGCRPRYVKSECHGKVVP